jgi:folate-binding protein YgfZ
VSDTVRSELPDVVRLGPAAVTPVLLSALQTGAVFARAEVGVLSLTGPGAVAAMQGLLTNDVEKPGEGAFLYGALLTPKGMIVVDGWTARQGTVVTYTVPAEGREPALAIFTRSIPPRLARSADLTTEVAVFRLTGPQALAKVQMAGVAVPPGPGRVTVATVGAVEWQLARASDQAPFVLQVTTPSSAVAAVAQRFVAAGILEAGPVALDCARILAGWPRLGAEVDEKTIPQEVRLEELGGVSFTKGCYTGQETVSRLHFRGHVNRHLRGLLFDAEPAADVGSVTHQDRDVGRVTSVAWMPELRVTGGGRWIGLAMVRRDMDTGTVVRAAGRDACVVGLPFVLPFTGPA